MNYTTVPRTWEKVNIWTHRIPVHYKVRPAHCLVELTPVHLSTMGLSASLLRMCRTFSAPARSSSNAATGDATPSSCTAEKQSRGYGAVALLLCIGTAVSELFILCVIFV